MINVTNQRTTKLGPQRRRGATLVLIVMLLVVILTSAAFAVDFGRMLLVRNQLQTAVDAGALAGSLRLKQDPTDIKAAQAAAREFVARNRVGFMVTVPEDAITVDVGSWDSTTRIFTSGTDDPDAISVSATQNKEPFFFAQMFGSSSFTIPRQSVAVAGGEPLEILMVLDLSISMYGQGRIEALQIAAPIFVDIIKQYSYDDRIGVMGYGVRKGTYDPAELGHTGVLYTDAPAYLFPFPSNYASEWVGILEGPITADFDSILNTALSPAQLLAGKYNGGTPIGAALRDGAHYLNSIAREETGTVLILMSDGEANIPESNPAGYALQMADYAKSCSVRVFTISLGDSADTELMGAIAAATGAKHFDATGIDGGDLTFLLTQAFCNIANEISRTTMVQ